MRRLFRIQNRVLLLIIILSSHTFCQYSISDYDFSPSQKWQHELPNKLKEISGLAYASDTRLFALNDERGIIYQINLSKGEIVKSFSIGKRILCKDFEGLAIAEKTFYAITSDGELYKFYEQKDGGYSDYKKFITGLSQKYDVEGLCFDPDTYSLLIACKGYAGKGNNNFKAIYSFDLNSNKINARPRYLMSLKDLKDRFSLKNFSPSGIERNPKTGHLFILSSNERSIVEISEGGELIAAMKLEKETHAQPEGIIFLVDNSILISDEGKNKKATLTRYFFKNKIRGPNN